jgi:hypothetical protein
MKRRDFLKFGTTGLAVVAVGTMADWPMFWRGSQASATSLGSGSLDLEMVEAAAEMVDGIQVPMWAFKLKGTDHADLAGGARIPGPVLLALEGDRLRLRITNRIAQGGDHGFAVPGVSLTVDGNTVSQVTVPPGEEGVEVEFTAPAAGTYMYFDPLNAPVNRVMGLHGALVVLPDPVGNKAPYNGDSQTDAVTRLFNDLGTTGHFPGNPWDPARNAVWVFNVIDPDKAAAATAGGSALAPATFLGGFLPQYFTINGKSGFFSAQHGHGGADAEMEDGHGATGNILSPADRLHDSQSRISISGTVGQPLVIRSLNAGLMWNSPHIHGNHVYPLAHANVLDGRRDILSNLNMVDTWTLAPGDVKDLLLPFIQPPDIPAAAWPPVQELFPLLYPMHDHNEISNTAAGGNYPQGMATHWQIDGPYDPSDPATGVISVERADLRVKTGQLVLEGHFTVPNQELALHAGGSDGPRIGAGVRVGADGRFSFRGRALKALVSRYLTLTLHDAAAPHQIQASRSVPLRLR